MKPTGNRMVPRLRQTATSDCGCHGHWPNSQRLMTAALLFLVAPFVNLQAAPPEVVKRSGPLRLQPHVIRGEAKIPEGVVFDVVCEINGELMKGDWKTVGKVRKVEPGRILFDTDEVHTDKKVRQVSHKATLAYRLPNGLKLDLSQGDPITILHDHEIIDKRFEWDIHISSRGELVLASSHKQDETPPLSADRSEVLFPGAPQAETLFYWSDPVYNETSQTRDQDLPDKIQLSIKSDVDSGPNNAGTVFETEQNVPVTLGKRKYIFVALSSEHSTYGEDEEHVDGDSIAHDLECILVRLAQ